MLARHEESNGSPAVLPEISRRTLPRGPLRVTHVITGLGMAGAELMLYRLLSGIDRARFAPEVISLTDTQPLGAKIAALGIPVRGLNLRRGPGDALRLGKLCAWLRAARPDVVQTWLYHADLFGSLAARFAGGPPVIWNIRCSSAGEGFKRSTVWTGRLLAWLSRRLPERIVCGSEAARDTHKAMGYHAERMVVIPNGYDTALYRPDSQARHELRRELGISPEALVIGLVARFDPLKDHETFVRSAAALESIRPGVRFLLCGSGMDWQNETLAGWIRQLGLQASFQLIGPREDVRRIYPVLDVHATSSMSEGFPNVVAEAMACGVPCAVTDVGDSARIVADTGQVAPPKDPVRIAESWLYLLSLTADERDVLGKRARRRIVDHYSLAAVVRRYEQLYEEVAQEISR
jgi:glycosyltransferase involved in cell wall biosynthesis